MTEEQNWYALKSLMFIKFNRYGRVNGRTCDYGQKQGKKAVPEDSIYFTVSTESVLVTATIDAHEVRNVRIGDIPGAFLSADMYKDVKMALCGRLSELVVKIASQIYR